MTEPIVRGDADVARILPPEYKDDEIAPVRDALVHAHAAQQIAYQEKSDYAAEQADIGRADGRYLTGLAQDRGFRRQDNEDDDEFRARTLAVPETVTPEAIVAAVNAILGDLGTCRYLESVIDRFYVNAIGGPGPDPDHPQICAGLVGATPVNTTRLYAEDGGPPARSPDGAWVFNDHVGRMFVLRVPHISSQRASSLVASPWQANSSAMARAAGVGSLFPRNTAQRNQAFIHNHPESAIGIYQRIADTVSAIVGQSIRWMMISDPRLNAT